MQRASIKVQRKINKFMIKQGLQDDEDDEQIAVIGDFDGKVPLKAFLQVCQSSSLSPYRYRNPESNPASNPRTHSDSSPKPAPYQPHYLDIDPSAHANPCPDFPSEYVDPYGTGQDPAAAPAAVA